MNPEEALGAIKEALFPEPRKEGDLIVSAEAYWNLAGALIDLARTGADAVCIRTIKRVQQQIKEVSKILEEAGFK